MATLSELYKNRFGLARDFSEETEEKFSSGAAEILNRRTHRRYTDEAVSDELLDALLACAQSAPAKSDLQQYSIIVITDPVSREAIGGWEGEAPVFMLFCADMRRQQRLAKHRGHDHQNNNVDTFMNGVMDATLAMQAFILAAESSGLGCCPISQVRNRLPMFREICLIPDSVFPVAGMCVGWPVATGYISMRVPPSVVVHRDKYDDSTMEAEVDAYDARRHAVYQIPARSQRHPDIYGILDFCSWSENTTRQLSLPERADFKAFLQTHGYDLD
jgi:nitroreductase